LTELIRRERKLLMREQGPRVTENPPRKIDGIITPCITRMLKR
jgi:hypothetical protein